MRQSRANPVCQHQQGCNAQSAAAAWYTHTTSAGSRAGPQAHKLSTTLNSCHNNHLHRHSCPGKVRPPPPPASPTCWFSSSCGSGILLPLLPPLLPAAAPPAAAGVRSGAAPSSSGPAALMQEPSSVATVREGSGALVKSRVDAWGWGKFVCEEGE